MVSAGWIDADKDSALDYFKVGLNTIATRQEFETIASVAIVEEAGREIAEDKILGGHEHELIETKDRV